MKLYPARAQTTLYHFDITCSIAVAGRTDATLTPGGRRFGFHYLLLRHWNARIELPMLPSCYVAVIFLLLDVTVFCKPMNASVATRQLLRRLAVNLHNLGLSEMELKSL